MRYTEINLVAQHYDRHARTWVQVDAGKLGDLFSEHTWLNHFPLRISVLGKSKVGVAENVERFKWLLDQVGHKEKTPYSVAKSNEHGFNGRPRGASRDAANPWGWLTEKEA